MGSVERVVRDGKVIGYQARWRDPARAQRKRTFRRKQDADRFLTSLTADLLRGAYVDPNDRTTVGELAAQWLGSTVHLKPSTQSRYRSTWYVHVEPRWAGVPCAAVQHGEVGMWVAQLTAAQASPSSVRKAFLILSGSLELAVRGGQLARNPCARVALPRMRRPEPRFLSVDQVEELAEHAGDLALLVRVLAYTGLRFGEAAALRVARVDLARRRLTVAESVTEVDGRAVWGTPNTHARRQVVVPASLVEELTAAVAGKARTDLVFAGPRGDVLRHGNVRSRNLARASKAAGIVPEVRPHDLRHTAASLAISAGATVKGVQAMLGHSSAAMTLDVYAGLFPDELDAVAEHLDAARAAARVPRMCPASVDRPGAEPPSGLSAETPVGAVGLEPTTAGL